MPTKLLVRMKSSFINFLPILFTNIIFFTGVQDLTTDVDLTGPRLLEFLLRVNQSAKEILFSNALTPSERFDLVETLMILASRVDAPLFKKWLMEVHFADGDAARAPASGGGI